MSEITSDYYNDADVQRWKVTAKAASLSGSGSISVIGGWVLTGDELPDELLDSDLSTADASGAPTLRASTDIIGINQIALHIVDFTPASGGSSGGATAEIWLNPGSYEGATDLPIYLWWGKSGKTQPAASGTYGKNNVYDSTVSAVWKDDDYTDATSNGNDLTATSITNASDSPYGTGLVSYELNGSSSYLQASDDASLDVTEAVTMEFWFKVDANTGNWQTLMAKRSPSSTYNYGTGINLTATDRMDVGFYASGFKSLKVTWSTNFGSTDTWYHIFAELEDTGSDIVERLYKNASSVGSQTESSINLITNASPFIIGSLSGTSEFFDGHLKAITIYKTILTSDQKTTRYNNQSDPSTFWDATAAVEAGPFSTEDNPKYQWTYQGRKRSWTVQIFEADFAGTTSYLCGGASMVGRWGFTTGTFDDRIRASELILEVVDPSLTVYNNLVDTSKTEDDFKLKMTDSTGTYTLRMRVRLDEVSTMLVTGLEHQVTRLVAYCGMAEMKNIDAIVLSSSTMSNLFRLILISSGVGQSIEYYLTHYAENAYTAGNMLETHRLNRLDLIYAEEGRKIDSMYDQLKGLLDGFGLIAVNGLDGKWHVKHEYSLGETKTDNGAQSFDFVAGSLSTLNTLSMSSKTVTDDILARGTIKYPLPPIQAVQVERGNARQFFTVDVMRHGDFENGWTGGASHEVWTKDSGTFSIESGDPDTGSFSLTVPTGSNQITQKLIRIAGGYQDIDIEVAFRYAKEFESGETVASGSHFVTLSYFNETTADTTAGDPGGDWTTDPINGAIALAGTPEANGDPKVYTTLVTTIYGPLPDYDGNLRIRLNSSLANFDVTYDTLEVRLKKSANAKFNFRAVSGRYDVSGNLIGSGGVAEQRVQFYNGIIGLDSNKDDARDSVHPMMQVITTAAGSWVQASDFLTRVSGFNDEYTDLFELVADIRIARQSETGEIIEGEVMEIVPHDHPIKRGSTTYLQQYTEIDFRTEVTKFVAAKKIGASDEFVSIFMIDDNDDFIVMNADFTGETDTGLNLTSQAIIDIEFNQVDGRVYGLNSTGQVYSWKIDGTDLTLEFSTGLSGFTKIAIDDVNQHIMLSRRNVTGSEYSSYIYNLAGTQQYTLNHRTGSTVLKVASYISGGRGYMYIWDVGSGDPNVKNSFRVAISDNTITGADNITLLGSGGDVCYDDNTAEGYRFYINNLYKYDMTSSAGTASYVTSLPALSGNSLSYFEYNGSRYIVGCANGAALWSFRIGDGDGNYTTGRTTRNIVLVTTRRPYYTGS